MNRLVLFIILIISSIELIAQTGTVRGFVYEETSGEPAMVSNLVLEGTKIGGVTDANGFFNLSKVPAGQYKLVVTYIGFDSKEDVIDVKADKILNKKLIFLDYSKKNNISKLIS